MTDPTPRNESGTAVVLLLLLLLPLAMVFGSFTMAMNGRDSRQVDEIARERCFWAAEAGIDDAIHRAGAGMLTFGAPMVGDLGNGLGYEVTAVQLGRDGVDNDGDRATDEADEDLVEIHSVGQFRSDRREITVWLGRTNFLPPFEGAMTVSSPTTDLRLSGTPRLDGSNWNLDGRLGDQAEATYGTSIMPPGTIAQLSSHLSGAETNQVTGIGGTPSLGLGPTFDVDELAALARNMANLVLTNSSYSSYSFGNARSGTGFVTYRDGDLRLAGNTYGAGILVVTGKLVVTGNFRFDGVVIVLGDFEAGAGTADVYGALVMGPRASLVRVVGTARLRYSDEAIRFANTLAGRYVAFNGWQELAR